MIGALPKSLRVDGKDYPINSDYRAALLVFEACGDNTLSPLNKRLTLLEILYTPLPTKDNPHPKPNIPPNADEAYKQAIWFFDVGINHKNKSGSNVKTIDYSQDEQLIFSAVNAVYSKDVRAESYMHWWTFYGLCQAIDSESMISTISGIRYKKATGKKLEKHEQDFYKDNRHLVDLNTNSESYEDMVRQLRNQ